MGKKSKPTATATSGNEAAPAAAAVAANAPILAAVDVPDEELDVLCVGAGLSGFAAAYHMQHQNPDCSFKILEKRPDFGGTWSLFTYPSARSDSDLFTFGLPAMNWKRQKRFGKGPEIVQYLDEFGKEFGLHKYITYNRRIDNMSWSDADGFWTVDVSVLDAESNKDDAREGDPVRVLGNYKIRARFMILATGYYSMGKPYDPPFPGKENFKGPVIHPQFWPKDLDYSNKTVCVIGSGATAITLIPGLTEGGEGVACKKAIMLQRSPTYIAMLPQQGGVVNLWIKAHDMFLHWFMSWNTVANIIRWSITCIGALFYFAMTTFPNWARNLLLSGVRHGLGPEADRLMPHFSPSYKPWDQRLCVTPDDNNIFDALRDGKADVVTDKIKCFDETGIQLESGARIDCDIIVTATGLELLGRGGIPIVVNGKPAPKPGDAILYRGCIVDLPSCFICAGFFNASWTQRVDPLLSWAAGLIKFMRKNNKTAFVPRISDEKRKTARPLHDMSSGYLSRGADQFPKQADFPYRFFPNVFAEWFLFNFVPYTWDGALEFSNAENKKSA